MAYNLETEEKSLDTGKAVAEELSDGAHQGDVFVFLDLNTEGPE